MDKLFVFVYGTLKKGFGNHDRFCGEVEKIMEGHITARLYDVGYPFMDVPEKSIHAIGTGDYDADASLLQKFSEEKAVPLEKGWDRIQGEILVFPDSTPLRGLDRLEGFKPSNSQNGFYKRVLVIVETENGNVSAWTYVYPEGEKYPRVKAWPPTERAVNV